MIVRRPSRSSLRSVAAFLAVAVAPLAPAARAQDGQLDISKAQEECFVRVPYPLVEALIRPQPSVQIAKVYFRAAQGPHFYAIEMAWVEQPAGYEAVLPVPGPDTFQIVYYVEAITPDFEAARTAEYVVDVVEGECDERLFGGDDPEIVIYATEAGAPALPVGFLPLGVAAAVSAGGVSTAVGGSGGGLGAGAIGGIVAGGVAGGILVAKPKKSPPPPTDEPEPPASASGGG
jgi:hypothetical protein